MITNINISNTATFGATAQILDKLKKHNFFFGANGTGKTTISRVIDNPSLFQNCVVTWANGIEMGKLVYNRDFVERNFQSSLKGVFTLGETESNTVQNIEITKVEIDKLVNDIKSLKIALEGEDGKGGKKKELEKIETEYSDTFFSSKQKHDTKLAGALVGFMGKKKDFKDKILLEVTNKEELKSIEELEARASKVFSNIPLVETQIISNIQFEKLLSLEQSSILTKRIIGKADVDIAAMIKKLDNSDWVRQGKLFYETNDNICPFCQQKTTEGFAKSLNEYFDESFEKDIAAINDLILNYTTESNRIQQDIQTVIDSDSKFIDIEKLKNEKKLLDSIIDKNIHKLNQKKKETSQIIELDSLKNIFDAFVVLIASANKMIDEHNAIVINLANEKKTLTKQVWRYIVEEQKADIQNYNKRKNDVTSAINNLEKQLKSKNGEKIAKETILSNLEKQIVSIIPTCDGINGILTSFGFKSFKLAAGSDGRTYKLVRANGLDAQSTLSEGERNFVSFLYFYHLLKGSHSESGITTDKIVVFDDPISSLDSDIMFIVSYLIRELIDDVRENKGTIKQIFILTHNVYFHKEVSFNSRRKNGVLKEESFWLIKKQGENSFVEMQKTNPIKTSYELLWDEVRSKNRNNTTIRNTLRRILESYFKLLGGETSLDALYAKFDGEDKMACKSLCSWLHEGSHNAFNDDSCTLFDDTTVGRYFEVFRQIFEYRNQIAHYNMMMGIGYDNVQEEIVDEVKEENNTTLPTNEV
jgi:wobble nucleotide-excising tRNase